MTSACTTLRNCHYSESSAASNTIKGCVLTCCHHTHILNTKNTPNLDMLLLLLLLLMLLAVPACYVTVMEAQLGAAASSGGHRRTL